MGPEAKRKYRDGGTPGGIGGTGVPLDFGRSVNPISTRGQIMPTNFDRSVNPITTRGQIMPTNYYSFPHPFPRRFLDLPPALNSTENMYLPNTYKTKSVFNKVLSLSQENILVGLNTFSYHSISLKLVLTCSLL